MSETERTYNIQLTASEINRLVEAIGFAVEDKSYHLDTVGADDDDHATEMRAFLADMETLEPKLDVVVSQATRPEAENPQARCKGCGHTYFDALQWRDAQFRVVVDTNLIVQDYELLHVESEGEEIYEITCCNCESGDIEGIDD